MILTLFRFAKKEKYTSGARIKLKRINKMQKLIKKLEAERNELEGKLKRLNKFFETDAFGNLTDLHQTLLRHQEAYMCGYYDTLEARIADLREATK